MLLILVLLFYNFYCNYLYCKYYLFKQFLQPCPGKSQCVATESQLHTFTTKDSVHHVTSDSICKCMARERKCRLRSHIQVFYGGTRFEKRINVGECVGRCKGGKKILNPQFAPVITDCKKFKK